VGDLVQERGQECIRIEVVVDGDPMFAAAATRRTVVTQFRPPGPGEPHGAGLPAEQAFYIWLRAGRQEWAERCVLLG
jgi:hypothetical protein